MPSFPYTFTFQDSSFFFSLVFNSLFACIIIFYLYHKYDGALTVKNIELLWLKMFSLLAYLYLLEKDDDYTVIYSIIVDIHKKRRSDDSLSIFKAASSAEVMENKIIEKDKDRME